MADRANDGSEGIVGGGKKAGHKCDELLQIHILNAVKYVKQQMPIISNKN